MSKTSYTNPEVGLVSDAATVNTMFSQLAGATVGQENLREEGVLTRSIQAAPFVEELSYIEGNPLPSTQFTGTSWTTLTIGATLMQTPLFTISAGERVRVDTSFELRTYRDAASTLLGYGLVGSTVFEWALWYTVDGGVLTRFIGTNGTVGPTSAAGAHYGCDSFIEISQVGTWQVSLRGQIPAGGYVNMAEGQMLTRRYKRSS